MRRDQINYTDLCHRRKDTLLSGDKRVLQWSGKVKYLGEVFLLLTAHDFLKGRLITLINYSSSKEILLNRKERKTSEFVKPGHVCQWAKSNITYLTETISKTNVKRIHIIIYHSSAYFFIIYFIALCINKR